MMACVGSFCRTLCSVIFVLIVQGNSLECLDKEIVTEMSKDVESPSACVLTCTVLTYRQILNRQQKLSVQFKDSDSGESGEFCWFIHMRCTAWDDVFVLLPVTESVLNGETVQLQTNSLIHTEPVLPHSSAYVLPEDCGLRFDVTPHVRDQQHQTFCVSVRGFTENRLQCPPYLVIIRNKHSTSKTRA